MRNRRAENLSEQEVQFLVEKVKEKMTELGKSPSDADKPAPESAKPEAKPEDNESPDGKLVLLDEQPEGNIKDAKMAMRIAHSRMAIYFPTDKAMKKYLHEHPDADKSKHRVDVQKWKETHQQEDEGGNHGFDKKPDVPLKPEKQHIEQPEKKQLPPKTEKPHHPKPHRESEQALEPAEPVELRRQDQTTAPDEDEVFDRPQPKKPDSQPTQKVVLQQRLETILGEESQGYSTHAIDKTQISPKTAIVFPDGTEKQYNELSADEKERVDTAIKHNNVAHKGLNDYTSMTPETLYHNMANNLSKFDDSSVQETSSTNTQKVTKENVADVGKTLRANASSVLKKYKSVMSSHSRPVAEAFVENYAKSVEEAVNDGSLGDVSEADLDAFMRDDVKRLMHQEVETRRRSLGDHGIRHCAINAKYATDMLGKMQQSGMPITGKQKLMAISVMASHDMGYTMGAIATDLAQSGKHKAASGDLAQEEVGRYEKVFGKDDASKLPHLIATHDSDEIDFDADPLASSVRLADNVSLFGEEKVQDLFLRSPVATEQACKLRLAAEMEPSAPKQPDRKKFTNDEDFAKADEKYKKDAEHYNSPEVQAVVKESRAIQAKVKEQMHGTIDGDDQFEATDRELLHRQVDEMSEGKFSTTVDILSRFSGKIEGFDFDAESKTMHVDMGYSPEGQMVQMLFGDTVSGRQFAKLADDLHGEQIKGQSNKTLFSHNGKPSFTMEIKGQEKPAEETANSSAMKDFASKTARLQIQDARKNLVSPPTADARSVVEAKKALEKAKSKFTDGEWQDVEKLFSSNDPSKILGSLMHWPLLNSEREFLTSEIKKAAMAVKIACSMVAEKIVRFFVKGI